MQKHIYRNFRDLKVEFANFSVYGYLLSLGLLILFLVFTLSQSNISEQKLWSHEKQDKKEV